MSVAESDPAVKPVLAALESGMRLTRTVFHRRDVLIDRCVSAVFQAAPAAQRSSPWCELFWPQDRRERAVDVRSRHIRGRLRMSAQDRRTIGISQSANGKGWSLEAGYPRSWRAALDQRIDRLPMARSRAAASLPRRHQLLNRRAQIRKPPAVGRGRHESPDEDGCRERQEQERRGGQPTRSR